MPIVSYIKCSCLGYPYLL